MLLTLVFLMHVEFTARDRMMLEEVYRASRQKPRVAQNRNFQQPHLPGVSDEVCVAKTSGIAANGTALCEIHQVQDNASGVGFVLADQAFNELVYNFTSTAVPAGTIVIARDRWGKWVPLQGGAATTATPPTSNPFACGPCCSSMPAILCGTVCTSTDPNIPAGYKFLMRYLSVPFPPITDFGACQQYLDTGTGTGTMNIESCQPDPIPGWFCLLPGGTMLGLASNNCGCVLAAYACALESATCSNVVGCRVPTNVTIIFTDGTLPFACLNNPSTEIPAGTSFQMPLQIGFGNVCIWSGVKVLSNPNTDGATVSVSAGITGGTPLGQFLSMEYDVPAPIPPGGSLVGWTGSSVGGSGGIVCNPATGFYPLSGIVRWSLTTQPYNCFFSNPSATVNVMTIGSDMLACLQGTLTGQGQPMSSQIIIPCCGPFNSGSVTLTTSGGEITVALIDCGVSGGS